MKGGGGGSCFGVLVLFSSNNEWVTDYSFIYVVCDFYTEILFFFFLMIFCVGLHFLLTVINWRLWRRR